MQRGIYHDRAEETLEAKTRWFRSLSLNERMDFLCEFTDLALTARPDLASVKDAEPADGRVLVSVPATIKGRIEH